MIYKNLKFLSNTSLIKSKEDYSTWLDKINFDFLIEENDKEIIFKESFYSKGYYISEITLSKLDSIIYYCKDTEKDLKVLIEDLNEKEVELLQERLKPLNFTLKKDFLLLKSKDMN